MSQLYKQNPAAETAPLGQGMMVLEPVARKFCALNPTSCVIWFSLKEPASMQQIAKQVSVTFQGVSEDDALRDVQAVLAEMVSLGIVVAVE